MKCTAFYKLIIKAEGFITMLQVHHCTYHILFFLLGVFNFFGCPIVFSLKWHRGVTLPIALETANFWPLTLVLEPLDSFAMMSIHCFYLFYYLLLFNVCIVIVFRFSFFKLIIISLILQKLNNEIKLFICFVTICPKYHRYLRNYCALYL